MGAGLHRCALCTSSAAAPDREVREAFETWCLVQTKERLAALRSQLEAQDRRVAMLLRDHGELEDLRARALSIVARTESEAHRREDIGRRCVVCLETIAEGEVTMHCSSTVRHCMCILCAHKYCDGLWHDQRTYDRVPCPCGIECPGELFSTELCKTTAGKRLYDERVHRNTVKLVHALLPALLSDSEEHRDAAQLKLAYLRSDGTYRGYMCPRCGYGPLEHGHCSSLTDHHGQARINNACVRCGHLEPDASGLMVWDGVVPGLEGFT